MESRTTYKLHLLEVLVTSLGDESNIGGQDIIIYACMYRQELYNI